MTRFRLHFRIQLATNKQSKKFTSVLLYNIQVGKVHNFIVLFTVQWEDIS